MKVELYKVKKSFRDVKTGQTIEYDQMCFDYTFPTGLKAVVEVKVIDKMYKKSILEDIPSKVLVEDLPR